MRLKEFQHAAICESFRELFDGNDHLWLFGSRVDDAKRGGDIDLYIETTETDVNIAYAKRLKLSSMIQTKIGEQKIDIVLNVLSRPQALPIYEIARKTGILLV